MFTFVLRRLLLALPVLLGVCTLTFLLIHIVPGDPADMLLGEQASLEDKTRLRQELGLDLPLAQQYGRFMLHLSQFDLGVSLHSRNTVVHEIAQRFPATAELTALAMILAIFIGLPLGIVAAVRQYSWADHGVLLSGLLGMSIPGFFLGPILIWIFAIQLSWFPVSERGGLEHLVLPALSLAVPLSSVLMRITRASMLEVIHEDYINVARAKGLSNSVIYFKHALRNALMPIVTIVGLQVGALLTGTVITETIFDWPGLGTLLFGAIQRRDYPLVQGCILFIAIIYVGVNILTDIAYGLVNPKVRFE